MRSRFLPYATTPGRLFLQLVSDVLVGLWIAVWLVIGVGVHTAIATIAGVGRQVKSSATGIAENLHSAGDSTHAIPLVGDTVAKPLRAAGEAALDLAGAGHNLDTTATWLAVLLALAVVAPPILAIGMPWLFLRVRFFRRKWIATALARTPAGEQLLALRALSNRPLRQLTEISQDPVGAWRREEALAIRGLAAIELRSAGITSPSSWR